MDLRLEPYEHRKHFKMVYRWWRDHRSAGLDLESLSLTGLVVFREEKALACAWIYLTNSKIANISWAVTSPSASMKEKRSAILCLIEALGKVAKDSGYTRLSTLSSSHGLTRCFEKLGFEKIIPHDFLMRAI